MDNLNNRCVHKPEWIPAEPDINVQEDYVCELCGQQLPFPEEYEE